MNIQAQAPITHKKPIGGAFGPKGKESRFSRSTSSRLDRLSVVKNYKSHPYYSRWQSILTRTRRQTALIGSHDVCSEWEYPSEVGFPVFLKWLIAELRLLGDTIVRDDFTITRRDVDLPWGPDNCILIPRNTTRLNSRTQQVKKPVKSVKERTMAISFTITPVRVTQENFKSDRSLVAKLFNFIDSLSIYKSQARDEFCNFILGKTDEVHLLQDPEGNVLLASFFSRYPILRTIGVSGIYSSLRDEAYESAVATAIGLIEDEVDYAEYYAVMVTLGNNAPYRHVLEENGFKPVIFANKSFLSKE